MVLLNSFVKLARLEVAGNQKKMRKRVERVNTTVARPFVRCVATISFGNQKKPTKNEKGERHEIACNTRSIKPVRCR